MKKKVTIQDIADALGVSRNTVSKAINNSEGLAETTREKILQKAVEMGYKQFSYVFPAPAQNSPQQAAAAAGEIALFTTIFLNQSHFASLMLDKLQRDLSQLGFTLNTHRVTAENCESMTLPGTFVPERTAAIVCVEMFDWRYDEMVCDLGLPVLFVDGPAKLAGESLPADQLYMDNTSEIVRFVNEMLRQGKRRIGFIGNYEHCQSFFERYMAFRGAMLLADAPVDPSHVIKCHSPAELTDKLSVLRELPEVFICANDFVAWDAAHILRGLGKRIPQDVGICGFDDAPESRLISPRLTTIHIHTQLMAFSAVQLLMARIKEPSLDYRVVHTTTDIIYRESTDFSGAGDK